MDSAPLPSPPSAPKPEPFSRPPAWRRPGLWVAVVLWLVIVGGGGWWQVMKFEEGMAQQTARQEAWIKQMQEQVARELAAGKTDETLTVGPTPIQATLLKSYLAGPRTPERLAQMREVHSQTGTMTHYGVMCLLGIGGPRDPEAALRGLRRGSLMGDNWATIFLAAYVSRGDEATGMAPDAAEARRLLETAVERKFETAAELLARMEKGADLWEIIMGSAVHTAAAAIDPELRSEAELPRELVPIPRVQVPPQYPMPLRYLELDGEVVVEFIVAKDGNVTDVKAVRSSVPGFEPAAEAAVRRWKFQPGVKDGAYVATQLNVPIVFTLDEAPAKPGPGQGPAK